MSTSSNSYRLPPLGRQPDLTRALASANGSAVGLTINGCILFLTGLMVFLSAFIKYRVEFGGLGVHPYLVPLGFAGCFVVVARLADFPVAALVSLILFTSLYCIATLAGPKAMQEIAKVVASAGTIVTVALLVRSEKDFRWGTLGLLLAVTALGIVGLFNKHESYTGVDPIQGSNENAFSLYTLAPMLLAGYIAMDKEVARWFKLILVTCLMVLVLAMFSNANRSGWLGVVLIGAMLLYRGQNLRAIIFVAAMAIVAYFIVVEYGDLKLISFRAKETFNNGSDFYRWQLFTGCFQIGLNNPLLGVSPQLIPQHLAKYVGEQKYAPDPHNVFASVWAGTGVISSCAMAWLAWSLWKTPIFLTSLKDALRSDKALRMQLTAPHRLLKMLLVLWIFRGTFSREILYSPAFCIGFGLVIGLGITHGMWKTPDRRTLAALAQQPTGR